MGVVYSDNEIKTFLEDGVVTFNSEEIEDGQIQPSSLDLRCGYGKRVWHMPYSSIPKGDLIKFLNSRSTHNFRLTNKKFLHKGVVYIIELEESLKLPKRVSARSNPKSTTGRLDIHARLLTEDGQSFDNISEGYGGKLFLEVVSNSFDLDIPPGYSFNQIRFFNGTERLDQGRLEYLSRSEPLLLDTNGEPIKSENFLRGGAVYLTLDLDSEDPGYKVRDDAPLVDLTQGKKSHPMSRYFEEVNLSEEGLEIIPDSFYLLKSRERSIIPRDHCAEMIDVSTNLGEFRAHYAGFFDPGFSSVCIMEVRNTSKTSFLLRQNQPISSLWFYGLIGDPSKVYGEEIGSNYQGQSVVSPAKIFDLER